MPEEVKRHRPPVTEGEKSVFDPNALESVLPYTFLNQPWWQKLKKRRYFYYFLSILLEGFFAGTYLFGYGGGETIFDLGVTGSALLTVPMINIATAILIGIGIVYQTYLMKKNEELLRKVIEDTIIAKREHLNLELACLEALTREYERIAIQLEQANELTKPFLKQQLSACWSKLYAVSDRLSMYQAEEDLNPEVQGTKEYYKNSAEALDEKFIAPLERKIKQTFYDKFQMAPPRFSPAEKKEEIGTGIAQERITLLYRTLFAFICVSATAVLLSLIFATPLGWGTLVGVLLLTGVYIHIENKNKLIEQRVSELSKVNHDIQERCKLAKQQKEGYKEGYKLDEKSGPSREQSISHSLSERPSPTTISPVDEDDVEDSKGLGTSINSSPSLSGLASRPSSQNSRIQSSGATLATSPHTLWAPQPRKRSEITVLDTENFTPLRSSFSKAPKKMPA